MYSNHINGVWNRVMRYHNMMLTRELKNNNILTMFTDK